MDILKRIDFVQQFANEYAYGSWSIDTDKWKHHVTPEFIEDIRQYIVSLQLKLMHEQAAQAQAAVEPKGCLRCNTPKKCSIYGCSPNTWEPEKAAVEPVNEWTVIAPDGTRFTGPTPLKAAFPASKYRLEIDPVAAAKFAEVIEQIREEGERENDECMEKFGTLDCPHCGGSGHIGDVQAADDKIKALAAGVKPFAYEIHAAMCEPELSYTKGGIKSLMQPLYTATAIAAARVAENERLACEFDKLYTIGGDEIGPAIRALIGANHD